ncbi:M24 family metallopeptidase, partial [Streptococcus pneumoniae]|uniref:M24 family metallopeptidase n=1 Tax=Streptococcus pneumoniae TaxID=1313 RepID=UPI000AD27D38
FVEGLRMIKDEAEIAAIRKACSISDQAFRDALDFIKPGKTEIDDQAKAGLGFRDFDKIPRDIIIEAGYGDYFTHGIGHGIGLDIHEEPYFSQTSTETIKTGMALTDEPGIYIEGKYGVRI